MQPGRRPVPGRMAQESSRTAVLNLIENHRIYPFYGQKCTQMCTLVCTIGTHTGNKPVVAIFKIEQNIFKHSNTAIQMFVIPGLWVAIRGLV
jgi:hypothetical protein